MVTFFLTSITDITMLNEHYFGINLMEANSFLELIFRFFFNLFITLVIARIIYFTNHKRKDYLFTYFIISTIIFLLSYLLGDVRLQIGFALGLFAVFSIIRYRTTQISIKEMTYLFIIIATSVINSLPNKNYSYAELLFANIAIIGITFALERLWLLKHESIKTIIYENIELIKPDKREELIQDIERRTGIKVHKVEIGRIDFLRDVARIRIYYYDIGNDINLADADDYYNSEDFED